MNESVLWLGTLSFFALTLSLDLFVFKRNISKVSIRSSLLFTGFWVTLALLFDAFIYLYISQQRAAEFITGYLVEQSLSIDNLFVFLLLFKFFKTPDGLQHRVLFWGVIGTIAFRAVFIFAGIELVNRFEITTYVLGAFLVYTAVKMILSKENEVHPENNVVLKGFKKIIPVTNDYRGNRFFIKEGLKNFATPLFVVLLVLETTDIVFALDSIPAIIGITSDKFIVFTSNIFAVLGLRTLYFAISGLMDIFHFLHYGLAVILAFIGIKILIQKFYVIDITTSLITVAGLLVLSMALSFVFPEKKNK